MTQRGFGQYPSRDIVNMPVINGTNASETIIGTDQNDSITPRDGNDTVYGLAGDDGINGYRNEEVTDLAPDHK